ncbi:hypothetical protein ROHU_000960 [Labeo rohita]|uniref:Uncharacterized protein n=1 Tax=Labeo rohita TaxID=84645 RepID=A0A498P4E0_LABRO|nr:hypothetical protein ROHU_000960 [Labeo rohita]
MMLGCRRVIGRSIKHSLHHKVDLCLLRAALRSALPLLPFLRHQTRNRLLALNQRGRGHRRSKALFLTSWVGGGER